MFDKRPEVQADINQVCVRIPPEGETVGHQMYLTPLESIKFAKELMDAALAAFHSAEKEAHEADCNTYGISKEDNPF